MNIYNILAMMTLFSDIFLPCLFQKQQLLKLNVPAMFMLVALDEGPGPPIKYQYAELGKLYAVVSQLVRCCDVSPRCQSSVAVSGQQYIQIYTYMYVIDRPQGSCGVWDIPKVLRGVAE